MTALRAYYLGTPLFMLFDLLWGLNVRAVALEHLPAARYLYYAFCLACGVATLRWPGWTGPVGVAESSVNVLLLILGVFLPYFAAIRALAEGQAVTNPFTPQFLVNFALSATAGTVGFYKSLP
jgi:hypothetical protein